MRRRTFLLRGALGGAAVALLGGTYLALRRGPTRYAPTQPLVAFTETTFGVVAALAAAHVTSAGRDPVAIAHAVDGVVGFQPPENRRDLNRALAAFETGLFGLFTRGSFRTFTELPLEAQRDAVRAWSEVDVPLLAGVFDSLRRLTLGAHYAVLENARATGYPGPPFEKPTPPPIVADQPLSRPFDPRAHVTPHDVSNDAANDDADAGPASDAGEAAR